MRRLKLQLEDKLSILADAAKYDVSCASSGSRRSNKGRQLGNTSSSGICHTYTEDGRCVSLLKILYTNFCTYDCAYCINRCSNDIRRTAFTPAEVVTLTIDFYRRKHIEGLFLSSGILRSPDDTMERLVRTVQLPREQGFNGYIHLKSEIASASAAATILALFAGKANLKKDHFVESQNSQHVVS
jgi:predicted DNA-binding helix-hairpin-helix protein